MSRGPAVVAVASGFPEAACLHCLKRAWLVGRLGPFIETSCDNRPGRRTPELLRLDDDSLLKAVAPLKLDQILVWRDRLDEGQIREVLLKARCWAVCKHDARFPVGLLDGADAPPVLIGRGDVALLEKLDPGGCVTVVGARRATGYGLEVAASLGRELAASGLTVISGLALGIDGAAHRGALEAGLTVAVLGGGADQPYPRSHDRLYRRILERGLVISEQPPGTGVRRWCFPARNRIMAALAGMTVVVEARHHSGSLITAEMAADAGRDVGAVPGPVTGASSAGTNELIASGASLIRDGQDVLDRLVGVGAGPIKLFGSDPGQEAMQVLEAVERGCETVDQVAGDTGHDTGEVTLALTRLELAGYLRGTQTGGWRRTTLAAPYPPRQHE